MSAPRFAFIDIGTNTILCLIAELRDGNHFRVLDDLAEITRLGQGVDQSGFIGSEGEKRSRDFLQHCLAACKSLGVQEITAVGTSALRDARNAHYLQVLGRPIRFHVFTLQHKVVLGKRKVERSSHWFLFCASLR